MDVLILGFFLQIFLLHCLMLFYDFRASRALVDQPKKFRALGYPVRAK